ncbi:hypothetical protein ACJIZ3_020548 [Penstemon smallii]|uniref:CCR4-NOT transcription complex subunit 10 n=1 Tax=Penstemon smallii TaxID=265156 RepID=A0ABD3SJ14_9LAMI
MDSASSSSPFAARDGSPPVEDDGSLSVTAGLAKEAALFFQDGKFSDCLRILNQLLQKKENDLKVRHNIVIAEHFRDGCRDPKRLIEALEHIKEFGILLARDLRIECLPNNNILMIRKQSEELACESGEQLQVSSNNESKPTLGVRRSNNAAVVYTDEFDTSLAMFNMAVAWFHLHDYAKSFSYLETLYQNIVPTDEGTALRICLLLLDVALLSHHASRSADVISYMEKVFCVNTLTNQVDNGTSARQPSLLVSKYTSLPSNSTNPDVPQSDSVVTTNTLENSLTRSLSEEALEDESLQLLSSLDITGQNLRRPSGITSSNDLPRNQTEESLSAIDLRLKLHLCKVRYMLLTRNLKAAKHEIKLAMNIAHGKDYPMALYLKSQLEYARGNHRKAIETGFSSMYYNNLGCIYYRLGKHHTSGVFFSKALSSSSHDKSVLITYNCGVHSLACADHSMLLRCFKNQKKGLIKSISSSPDRSGIGVNVIGKGKWRQLALGCKILPNDQWECVGKDDMFPSDGKQPDLSMSLASQCLVNALYLLDSSDTNYSKPSSENSELRETSPSQNRNHEDVTGDNTKSFSSSQVNSNGEVKEQKVGNNPSALLQNSITHYEHICKKENHMMKQATLADLAYVELTLGNPLKALSTAKSLLELPECSRIYIFLGTMYAAEALCLLNKPKEAADHLMKYVSNGSNVELPYNQVDCEKWTVEKVVDNEEANDVTKPLNANTSVNESQWSVFSRPEEARGIFCANYAANFALLGDLEQAHHYVMKALSDIPNSSQAILTAIYVDLKRGQTQEALSKLKQHSGIRFLPGGLALKG